MFRAIFPIHIAALSPLHRRASFIWLSGVVCLWLLALLDGRALAARFDEEYRVSAVRVGRLWPRPGRIGAALTGWCEPPAQLRAVIAWAQEHGRAYALRRRPQYLPAMAVTLLVTRPFDPTPLRLFFAGGYYHLGAYWPAYALALWALAPAEDHLPAARHGAAQADYARAVPGLFPN